MHIFKDGKIYPLDLYSGMPGGELDL